jgi:hypothetical protein
MRPALNFGLLLIFVLLVGCGAQSAVIRTQALSYDDVIEDTTDKLLVLNILRAKDKAPLHFDEIPSIHESIQATASLQASWPFGPRLANANTGPRNMIQPTLGVQVTPTFEVDHLDTKDFVTGIASPVDPKFVKYWLDRGLDRRIVLLLFFSAVTITETERDAAGLKVDVRTVRLMNSPRIALETLQQQISVLGQGSVPAELRCDTISDFQRYLKLIDSLQPFAAKYYRERQLLATIKPDTSSFLKDMQGLDPEKFQVVPNPQDKSRLDLFTLSADAKTSLCPIPTSGAAPKTQTCIQLQPEASTEEQIPPEQLPMVPPDLALRDKPSNYCATINGLIAGRGFSDATNAHATVEIRLEIRSVGEMIQFLGDLLEYQDELAQILSRPAGAPIRLNDPLTFGYCADQPAGSTGSGCDDVFFNLPPSTCNSRFAVSYRGRTYAVPNYNPPEDGPCESRQAGMRRTTGRDHTLEVLSIVHQMVDLQKSAKDIRETPYVQVLP